MTKILFNQQQIDQRIAELAQQLSWKFENQYSNITAIVVLNGAMFFAVDLLKQCRFDCTVDFCKVNTYIDNRQQKQPNWLLQPQTDLDDHHIIIIEDIVDSGNTMKFILRDLERYLIKSCTIVSLLKRSTCDIKVDYVGFEIKDQSFVYGYGLDDKNTGRTLTSIYKI